MGSAGGTLAAAVILMLGGCSVPKEVDPVEIWRRVSGAADAGRPPPPGMDGPSPNLASVPPRPERPSAESRAALTAALAADRSRSRDPVAFRQVPAGPAEASPGSPLVPGAPPRPASLAAAPPVTWGAPAAPAPERPTRPSPQAPARAAAPEPPAAPPPPPVGLAPQPALPEMPAEAPAPPPAELLAPAPRNR